MNHLLWPTEEIVLFLFYYLYLYSKFSLSHHTEREFVFFYQWHDNLTFSLLHLFTPPLAIFSHFFSHFSPSSFHPLLPNNSTLRRLISTSLRAIIFSRSQPWRMTASRWCSSHRGWCASRWPTSACTMRAATSASSTRTPRTTRWQRFLFRCPQRRQRWRWSKRPWRAERRNSPARHRAASRLPPCAGSVMAERYQVPHKGWQTEWWVSDYYGGIKLVYG